MNNSASLTPVQGPSTVACMLVTSLSQLSHWHHQLLIVSHCVLTSKTHAHTHKCILILYTQPREWNRNIKTSGLLTLSWAREGKSMVERLDGLPRKRHEWAPQWSLWLHPWQMHRTLHPPQSWLPLSQTLCIPRTSPWIKHQMARRNQTPSECAYWSSQTTFISDQLNS